jgi:glutaconate CoA-transferase subunit A
MGYSTRDNRFYTEWDQVSRDRDVFSRWVEVFIRGTDDFAGYRAALEDRSLLEEVLGARP